MSSLELSRAYIAFVFVLILVRWAAAAPAPAQSDLDKVNAEIKSSDKGQQDDAIKQIDDWIASAHPVRQIWVEFGPELMKAGRNEDAADIMLRGSCERPDLNSIVPMMEIRVNALLAAGKNDEALAAAKSYYNVCDMKYTSKAIDMLAICLARTHPDDLEIARRFRNEQASASSGQAASMNSGQALSTGSGQVTSRPAATNPASRPASMLKDVAIDGKIWEDAIKTWEVKISPVSARGGYGDLLLVADRPEEAEKAFREMYQLASTQDDLSTAIEGIARSLRAEDGNLGRANAWLASLQKAAAP